MRRIKLNLFLLCSVITALAFVTSCSEDSEGDPDKDYVGSWESEFYYNADTVLEKMSFVFTNTTFEDKIYQGATVETAANVASMKGSIDNTSDNNLYVEILALNLGGAGYIDKTIDPASFENAWDLTLGQRLLEEFEATYVINADTLIFTLPTLQNGDEVSTALKLVRK